MLTMDQIHHIRELYYGQGITNISTIAEMTGHNRKTVTKYIDMEDFSSPPSKPSENDEHTSKLDPYKPIIDSWLIADKKAPRKQRHNAKRVFRRLSKEIPEFDCSYRTVAAYVSLRKKELIHFIYQFIIAINTYTARHIIIYSFASYKNIRSE